MSRERVTVSVEVSLGEGRACRDALVRCIKYNTDESWCGDTDTIQTSVKRLFPG
jgi:hypothetical protein